MTHIHKQENYFHLNLKKKVLQGFLYLERGVDDILLVIFRV